MITNIAGKERPICSCSLPAVELATYQSHPTAHQTDWATCVDELVHQHFPNAERCVLVEDNLNTHTPAALYESFEPAKARSILDRLELHFTTQAWQLAQHGGDRIQRSQSPMFECTYPDLESFG